MRLGTVIGRITLGKGVDSLRGSRWLLVSPLTREQLPSLCENRGNAELRARVGRDPSLVVYDNLGAGLGDTIGFVEGREAAMPFDAPTPIDAINAAIVDKANWSPAA